MMTAAQILAIKPNNYASIFPDKRFVRTVYTSMLQAWHPDHNQDPNAAVVTSHLVNLYEAACKARDAGTWASPNSLLVMRGDDKRELLYLEKKSCPIGDIYFGKATFVVAAKPETADLIPGAIKTMTSLPDAPPNIRDKMPALLPDVIHAVEPIGSTGYGLRNIHQLIRLRDILDKKSRLEAKHVAWIISGAYNMACYLEFAGVTHLGFDADHVFIGPKTHQVALWTGWEFASLRGQKPKAAAPVAASIMGGALSTEPTSPKNHLRLIRHLGLTALGDPTGSSLSGNADIPPAMLRWFRLPPGSRAQPEYEAWGRCLTESFGPRRYHELPISYSDIYGE